MIFGKGESRLFPPRLPRPAGDRPFRYLGRRVVQAIVEAATTNPVLGRRTAPGSYLVIRRVADAAEREEWERLFAESREALLREIRREADVREIQLRSDLEVELLLVTDAEAEGDGLERLPVLAAEDEERERIRQLLREQGEAICPCRAHVLVLETEPPQAQAYVDDRPVGITPCQVEGLPGGRHRIAFSRPGYLLHEAEIHLEPSGPHRVVHRAALTPEPPMGLLEVRTFPPGARVTIGEETRAASLPWRLPAGPVTLRVELEGYEPETVHLHLPPGADAPHRVAVRLRYAGPDRDEVVGDLTVEYIGPAGIFPESDPRPLARYEIRRGVLLIGRPDPTAELTPDIRLFDSENSVSRGCHAWLWVYVDPGTGADYNTFLIGNNSPAGIRVDGDLVMETRRLPDVSQIDIGNFRLLVSRRWLPPRVELPS